MVWINNYRLEDHLENYKENMEDLSDSIKMYMSVNNDVSKRICLRDIKDCVRGIFTITEEYLGTVLKSKSISVTNRSFKDCLRLAESNNLIDPNFSKCVMVSIKFRNYHSHNYQNPSERDYIEFAIKNTNHVYSQIKFIEDLLNCGKDNSSDVLKDSSVFH